MTVKKVLEEVVTTAGDTYQLVEYAGAAGKGIRKNGEAYDTSGKNKSRVWGGIQSHKKQNTAEWLTPDGWKRFDEGTSTGISQILNNVKEAPSRVEAIDGSIYTAQEIKQAYKGFGNVGSPVRY